MNSKLTKNILIGVGAAATTFVVTGLVVGSIFKTKKYKIVVDGLKNEVNIGVIGDMHQCNYSRNKRVIVRKMKRAKLDAIFLLGDINTNPNSLIHLELLHELRQIAPVYFVRGNRDDKFGNYAEFKAELELMKINVLEDDNVLLNINGNEFNLIGLNDLSTSTLFKSNKEVKDVCKNANEVFKSLYKPEMNNIVLAHRPNYLVDLLDYRNVIGLAAHTNGGYISLPNASRGLFVADQGIMSKYTYGAYRGNNSLMLVTSGVGISHKIPKFYVSKEVVIINMEGSVE